MRHVRFIPVVLFTALLSFASARGSNVAGSWPEATAICAVVAAATGVLLASIAAWDAGSQDATFLRSTSTSRARTEYFSSAWRWHGDWPAFLSAS